MMKYVYFFIVCFTPAFCSAMLGPNMLQNSPSGYLVDLANFLEDGPTTQQIGNELFERDFLATIDPAYSINGRSDERQTNPPDGYTAAEGMWVWIPTSYNVVDGTWYWILWTMSYYMWWWNEHIVSFE